MCTPSGFEFRFEESFKGQDATDAICANGYAFEYKLERHYHLHGICNESKRQRPRLLQPSIPFVDSDLVTAGVEAAS